MIRLTILYLVMLLVSCGQKQQAAVPVSNSHPLLIDSIQALSITNATAEDFLKAKQVYQEKTVFDTTVYRKYNHALRLPLYNKSRPLILKDTLVHTDDTEVRTYKYLGQFEKIGFYIVSGLFWEHYECYLIDKRTGDKTVVWNQPSLSPGEHFLANLSMDYGLEGVPNGLQIWRLDPYPAHQLAPVVLKKCVEIDQQIWAPTDFVWENDYALIVKVAAVEKFMNENGTPNQSDFFYLRCSIK